MANIILQHIYEVEGRLIEGIEDKAAEGLSPFSDLGDAEYYGNISKIKIYCGEIVDRVQFIYESGHEGGVHGGSGIFNYEFALEEGEYITKIDWDTVDYAYYGGRVLAAICFTTNRDRSFQAEAGFKKIATDHYSYNAEGGHAIVGLKGYCGKYLNGITKVYVRETADNFKDEQYYYNDYYSLVNAGRLTKVAGYSGLVIDKLQFIYDDDAELTRMHGNGWGTYFEFVLDEGEYFVKAVFRTAKWKYSKDDVPHALTQIQMWTNKGRELKQGLHGKSYPELSEKFNKALTHRHIYTIEMGKNEEIFCLAGMYSVYMGRILTVYKRIRQAGQMALLSSDQININSDGKEYLFVCQKNKKDGGVISTDKAVTGLVDMMLENCKKLDAKYLDKISFLPDFYHSSELNVSQAIISTEDFEKALLSGQYRYISVRSHGTEAGCGNFGAGLVDVKWVREHKSEIKQKLRNTIINFNCCECGYRNITSQYSKGDYKGIAREFVEAGVRAVFAYTISYLSVERPLDIMDSTKKGYYYKFYNMIDNMYLKGADAGKDPEEIGNTVKKEFEALLYGRNPKIVGGYVSLLQDISDKCGAGGVYFKDKKEIALAIGKKLWGEHPSGKQWFTQTGSPKTTEGALEIRARFKRWLHDNFKPDIIGIIERTYEAYIDFYINYTHLCGPGEKSADSALRKDNQGEFCNEFCNKPEGEL